jgi:hypothetical protein
MEVKRSDSRAGRFSPGEKALDTHCIGGWVGPRAVLEAVPRRKKIPTLPYQKLNPGRPDHSRLSVLTIAKVITVIYLSVIFIFHNVYVILQ